MQSDAITYLVEMPSRILTPLPVVQSGLTYTHRVRGQYLRENDTINCHAKQTTETEFAVYPMTLEQGDYTDGIWSVELPLLGAEWNIKTIIYKP